VFENCRCARNRSSLGSDLKICLFSENFPIFLFLLHITRGVTRGARGTIPWTPNHCGGPKSYNNVISTSLNTVHLLPKDFRFEHGGANLVSCSRRRLTSLHLCTSRLSSQIGEICLQKYLSIRQTINRKLFKQNAVDSKSFDHRK